jgi:hypothetical protein
MSIGKKGDFPGRTGNNDEHVDPAGLAPRGAGSSVQRLRPDGEADADARFEGGRARHELAAARRALLRPRFRVAEHAQAAGLLSHLRHRRSYGGAGAGKETILEHHTISWLPATLVIRPLHFRTEPGVNLGLHDTMTYALRNEERISEWGPYECRPRFFHRFLVQKNFLESGAVGYQCVDNVGESARTGNGCACIHAITDMDPLFSRANYPLIWYGEDASANIVGRLHERGSLLQPEVPHDWLNEALGLNAYPIIRRTYRKPLLAIPLSRVT